MRLTVDSLFDNELLVEKSNLELTLGPGISDKAQKFFALLVEVGKVDTAQLDFFAKQAGIFLLLPKGSVSDIPVRRIITYSEDQVGSEIRLLLPAETKIVDMEGVTKYMKETFNVPWGNPSWNCTLSDRETTDIEGSIAFDSGNLIVGSPAELIVLLDDEFLSIDCFSYS